MPHAKTSIGRLGTRSAPRFGPAALACLGVLLVGSPLAAQTYSARYEVPAGGFSMCAGDARTLSVRITNTGTRAWGSDTHLGYHWTMGPTTVVRDGPHTLLPGPVNPGGSVTVNATVTAPASPPAPAPPAVLTLSFDLVDNTTWFSAQGVPTGDVPNVTILARGSCLVALLPTVSVMRGPHIDHCAPAVLRPGTILVCNGSRFGAHGWKATLKLRLYDTPGTASVDLPIYLDRESSWRDDMFQVTVSTQLAGFRRSTATVSIDVHGVPSNEFPIPLEPVLETKWADEYVLRNTACGGASGGGHQNRCGPLRVPENAFSGSHANSASVGGADGDRGRDVWTGTLFNDWVFVEPFTFQSDHAGQATASGFTAGRSTLDLAVDWHYDWGMGRARTGYTFTVKIQGPRGVPYRFAWN